MIDALVAAYCRTPARPRRSGLAPVLI